MDYRGEQIDSEMFGWSGVELIIKNQITNQMEVYESRGKEAAEGGCY